MTTVFFSKARVILTGFVVVFGLFAVGCEITIPSDESENAETSSSDTETEAMEYAGTTNAQDSATAVPASDTAADVLNDDPNCEIVIKYQGRDITNAGQVHYVDRVLVSRPFGSANPVCVQYNDTQSGETTVWKNPSHRGEHVERLPRDRGIDKIVVWYE